MILVVGASGRLGSAVAAALLKRGEPVRVASRDPAKLAALAALGAEPVAIDLRRPEGLGAALDGVDRLFTAVHALTARARGSIGRVDVAGHKALVDAATALGVPRFVYSSALGASDDHPAPFWRAKAAVERHLVGSGLDYTILRPAAFMDLHADELIGSPVRKRGRALILGRGDGRRNLVAVADVVAVAVLALTGDRLSRRTVEIAGPDHLSDREVAALYAGLAGKPLRIRNLPAPVLRLLAPLVAPLHAGAANILRLPLQMAGRAEPDLDPAATAELIGREPVSLAQFAAARLQEER